MFSWSVNNATFVIQNKVHLDEVGILFYVPQKPANTLNIGFLSLFQLCVRFPAAILETLVEISENFLEYFLAHTCSGKMAIAFLTIISDF